MTPPRLRPSKHFLSEMLDDDISWDEVFVAWMKFERERPSQSHPGALVRTALVPDRSSVTVVGRLTENTLELITTWRNR
jgi:hypothetical protein